MTRTLSILLTAALAVTTALTSFDADARRLGGGRSVGQQSHNVTQREAVRPATAPTQQQAAAGTQQAAAARPGAPAPAAAPKRNWGGMLGGIAAGLGLAWLAHSLGLGESFGNLLTVLTVVALALMAWRFFARRRSGGPALASLAGAAAGSGGGPGPDALRTYNPKNVGNDASARPWEQSRYQGSTESGLQAAPVESNRFGGGSLIGSAIQGGRGGTWSVPPDFDTAGFLAAAKSNFLLLQQAWDKGDAVTLRSMMTDDMLSEIQGQLAERERTGSADRTEVLTLDAQLLGIEDRRTDYLASVEFSGMIREDAAAHAQPFREVWNMSKPKSGQGGWLVAGLQALQ